MPAIIGLFLINMTGLLHPSNLFKFFRLLIKQARFWLNMWLLFSLLFFGKGTLFYYLSNTGLETQVHEQCLDSCSTEDQHDKYVTELMWTGPLACLSLSSVCEWIRVWIFDSEYCSLPVLYYHQMKGESRVKSQNLENKTTLKPRQCVLLTYSY